MQDVAKHARHTPVLTVPDRTSQMPLTHGQRLTGSTSASFLLFGRLTAVPMDLPWASQLSQSVYG